MSVTIGPGITVGSGITIGPPSSLILSLDASNPTSYSGTGTNWVDLSAYHNNFTLIDSPPWTSNGQQSYFTFNSGAGIAMGGTILPNNAYTKVGIFRYPAGYFGNIISGGVSGNDHAFWGSDTTTLFAGHNGNWQTIGSATPVPSNQWVFVAVSFNTTTGWRLYLLNNPPVTNSNTETFAVTPAVVEIGGFQGDANNLVGDVALVQIYNTVLSDADITALYNQYRLRFGY